jgi:hypothetical protein
MSICGGARIGGIASLNLSPIGDILGIEKDSLVNEAVSATKILNCFDYLTNRAFIGVFPLQHGQPVP